jgi:tetratricopeptide (TPR) repeat protein
MKKIYHPVSGRRPGTALAIMLLAGTLVQAQTSNRVAVVSVRELSREAAAYEQSGDRAAAVRTYERIVEMDATKRSVVSHRLVRLYADLGRPEAALKWAKEIAGTHPEPQAYLAGVLSLVGRHEEAEKLIRNEIAGADSPRRKMVLHWQLAEAYRRQGREENARAALESAVAAVKGLPEEKQATRRLARFGEELPQ